jgi:preprotein translocase subunit YajC
LTQALPVDLENPENMMIWMMLAFQNAQGQPPTWTTFVPLVAMMAIVYFLFLAPMRKRQKALADMVGNLKKGDKIITSGGLYGEISGIDGDTVVLKIADNVRIKLAKSAIATVADTEKEGDTQK